VLGCGGCCPWLMLVWAAMADLLVFSVLVLSSQSIFVSAGYCRRPSFVKEYAVDQWRTWRTSHLLHHFLLSLVLPQTIFPGGIFHICWLMRKEQPFTSIMELWKSALCLGNIPLQCLELRAKRGGKMGLHVGAIFPSLFELF
jgi:hypothetical protein